MLEEAKNLMNTNIAKHKRIVRLGYSNYRQFHLKIEFVVIIAVIEKILIKAKMFEEQANILIKSTGTTLFEKFKIKSEGNDYKHKINKLYSSPLFCSEILNICKYLTREFFTLDSLSEYLSIEI